MSDVAIELDGNTDGLALLHIGAARAKALRIFSFASTVYPGEWAGAFVEMVSQELVEFAFHARRVNNLFGFDHHVFQSIQKFHVQFDGGPELWEDRYQAALNRLLHATHFVFGSAHADHRVIFTNAQSNIMPFYAKVASSHLKEPAAISLVGISLCYLDEVLTLVKNARPNWTI